MHTGEIQAAGKRYSSKVAAEVDSSAAKMLKTHKCVQEMLEFYLSLSFPWCKSATVSLRGK